jgi:catalase
VRGFALKFYTEDGNYDIVGNNTPVFFIKDAMKFPDFIHSQKRLPDSGLRDPDMQWDFWTLSPETAHQVTYLMGDRGIPATWRTMNGYGSHTFQWINAAGDRFWVKYHMISRQGSDNMDGAAAETMAGVNADYYRQDLFDAIARGDWPAWDLKVQIMPYAQAKDYRFNPFDLTKIWPHGDYPLIDVGTYTLNRNPDNFFAEIEQAAFSPANMVPGTDISPDKMLMARVFSYPDAQRYRVGTNYQQLPVNAPHAATVHSYTQDGAQRHHYDDPSVPVYAPNSFGGPVADQTLVEGSWQSDGELVHAAATRHAEDSDFGQAGTLYRDVFSPQAKARFVATLIGQGRSLTVPVIKSHFIQYWTNVDADLGAQLARARDLPVVQPGAK